MDAAFRERALARQLPIRRSATTVAPAPIAAMLLFLLSWWARPWTEWPAWPSLELRRFGTRHGTESARPRPSLPPLEHLLSRNGTVVGDISWMLDFAIIAFPKSGTTFLKNHLNRTNQTYVYEREFCMKHVSDVADFVKIYYDLHVKSNQTKHSKTMRFGLKCPGVFYRAEDIHIYAKHFPRTKFIVGLRHPISWFESFYNYQRFRNISLPKTSQLIGRCAQHQKVCTDRARFHAALARLGKTAMKKDHEIDLLFGSRYEQQYQNKRGANSHLRSNNQKRFRYLKQRGLPNQVFLYELREIHNQEAAKDLDAALSQYLGTQEEFPVMQSYEQTKPRAINICDGEHDEARRLLAEHGTDASEWIQRYLLKNPSVQASARDSFHRYLDDWGIDPCSNDAPA